MLLFFSPWILWYLSFCFKGVGGKNKPGLSGYEESCLNAVSTMLFCHLALKKNDCSSLDELFLRQICCRGLFHQVLGELSMLKPKCFHR